MEISYINTSFIISVDNHHVSVSYSDMDTIKFEEIPFYQTKGKTTLAKSNNFENAKYYFVEWDEAEYKFNSRPLKFSYDTETREFVCKYDDNGPKVFKIKYETPKRRWMDQNPGPYATMTLYDDSETKLQSVAALDYIYHLKRLDDNDVLFDPNEMLIIVPKEKVEMLKEYACQNGITVGKVRDISDDTLKGY